MTEEKTSPFPSPALAMPVQFVCEHCQKTLKVGRRKIGEAVTCPKCGGKVTVPPEEVAAMAVALSALEKAQGKEPERIVPEFAVFDYDAPATTGVGRRTSAPAADPSAKAAATTSRASRASSARAFASAPASPSGAPMLLISRTTLYAQAVLFLIVALGAFGAGYLIGYGRSPGPAAAEAETQPVVVQGSLFYHDSSGRRVDDNGAAVLALPRGEYPAALLSVKGLNPRSPEPAAGNAVLLALEEIGAAYTRADERGEYLLSVPRPGSYRLLTISNGARRPEREALDEADLDELRKYFSLSTELIGRCEYDLSTVELAAGQGIVTHSRGFGVAGR